MARHRSRRSVPSTHRFERTDRVAQVVRAIVASEMERIGEAFEAIVITGVEVDRELATAVVYYDVRDLRLGDPFPAQADQAPDRSALGGASAGGSPAGAEESSARRNPHGSKLAESSSATAAVTGCADPRGSVDDLAEATFEEHRHRLQRALGEGTSLRRTPTLRFCRDRTAAEADRIERLLSDIATERSGGSAAGSGGSVGSVGPAGLG